MKLYNYFRSSASFRVRIALNFKGLPYEYAVVHLTKGGGQQFAPEFRAINPDALIPVLDDDGQRLTQSLAIIEYLEETHPEPPLLPRAPLERAYVRAIALGIACEIHPLNNLRVLRYLVRDLKATDEQKDAWYRHWVEQGLAVDRGAARRRRSRCGRYALGNRGDARRRGDRPADLQREAVRLPARSRADRHADLRPLHGAAGVRRRAAGAPARRRVTLRNARLRA